MAKRFQYKETVFGPPGSTYVPTRGFAEKARRRRVTYFDVRREDDETRQFDPGFVDIMKESLDYVREMARSYRHFFTTYADEDGVPFWPRDEAGKPPQSKGQLTKLGQKYESYTGDRTDFLPVEDLIDIDLRNLVAAYRWLLKKIKDPAESTANLQGFKGAAGGQNPYYTRLDIGTGEPITPTTKRPPSRLEQTESDPDNSTMGSDSWSEASTTSVTGGGRRRSVTDSLDRTERWAKDNASTADRSRDSGMNDLSSSTAGHPSSNGNQSGGAGAIGNAQLMEMMQRMEANMANMASMTERLEKKIDDNRAEVNRDMAKLNEKVENNSRPGTPRSATPQRESRLPDGMQNILNTIPSNSRYEPHYAETPRGRPTGRGRGGGFGRGRGLHNGNSTSPYAAAGSNGAARPDSRPNNGTRRGAKNYRYTRGRQHYQIGFEVDGLFKKPIAINGPRLDALKCRACNEYGHEMRFCPRRKCFDCGRNGHYKRDCPQKYDTQEQYHNRVAASARVFRKEEVGSETYHELVSNVYNKLEPDYGQEKALNFDQIIDIQDEYTTNLEYDLKDKFRQWNAINKKWVHTNNFHSDEKRHCIFIQNITEQVFVRALGTKEVEDVPERNEEFSMKVVNLISKDSGMNPDYIRDTIRSTEITKVVPSAQGENPHFNIEVEFYDTGAVTRILDLIRVRREEFPNSDMTGTYKEALTATMIRNDNAVRRSVDESNEKEDREARQHGDTLKDPWVAVGPPGILKRVRRSQVRDGQSGIALTAGQEQDEEEGTARNGQPVQQRRNKRKRHWISPHKDYGMGRTDRKRHAPNHRASTVSLAELAGLNGGPNAGQA